MPAPYKKYPTNANINRYIKRDINTLMFTETDAIGLKCMYFEELYTNENLTTSVLTQNHNDLFNSMSTSIGHLNRWSD